MNTREGRKRSWVWQGERLQCCLSGNLRLSLWGILKMGWLPKALLSSVAGSGLLSPHVNKSLDVDCSGMGVCSWTRWLSSFKAVSKGVDSGVLAAGGTPNAGVISPSFLKRGLRDTSQRWQGPSQTFPRGNEACWRNHNVKFIQQVFYEAPMI